MLEAALREALEFDPQFCADTLEDLRHLQQVLKLRDEDVRTITTPLNIDLYNPNSPQAPEANPSSNPSSTPTPKPPVQNFEDDLRSEKGIDYTCLRNLLKAQDWKADDEETYETMIRAVGKRSGGWFSEKDLLNFPCADLKTIDGLWVKYSQGHFGFSVQKKIYMECGGRLDCKYPGDEVWEKFGDRVGWRYEDRWLYFYSDLNFSLSSTQGILPWFLVVARLGLGEWVLVSRFLFVGLFSCIEACGL